MGRGRGEGSRDVMGLGGLLALRILDAIAQPAPIEPQPTPQELPMHNSLECNPALSNPQRSRIIFMGREDLPTGSPPSGHCRHHSRLGHCCRKECTDRKVAHGRPLCLSSLPFLLRVSVALCCADARVKREAAWIESWGGEGGQGAVVMRPRAWLGGEGGVGATAAARGGWMA